MNYNITDNPGFNSDFCKQYRKNFIEGKMDTKEFWSGEFGTEYTKRNRVDWRKRIPFWEEIIELTGARSVFEFGCNAGWNLSALREVNPNISTRGYEINGEAAKQARCANLYVASGEYHEPRNAFDLTFTAGVLIHIPPGDLEDTMQKLIDASADYVLAIEYADEKEVEVEYRGHKGKLWRRPYGKLYQDMGLKMVMESGPQPEFDNSNVWLLRK